VNTRPASCLLIFTSLACPQQEDPARQHAQAGAAAMAAKNWDLAEREYRAAMQINAAFPELASNLGLALYFQKKTDAASAMFEQALRADPALFVPNLFLGRLRINQGKAPQAVRHLEQCARMQPDNVLVRRYLAEGLVAAGAAQRALGELREAARLAPNDTEVFYSLSKVAMDLARTCFNQAASHPAEGKQYQNLILARHYEQQGSVEIAKKYYAAVPRSKTPDPPNDDQALKQFQERLNAHPADAHAAYWLGRCYERVTREALARITVIEPDSHRVHQLTAELAMEQDRPRDAIEQYTLALARKPDDMPLRFGLGQAYMKDGQFGAAISAFGKVLELEGAETSALLNIARCYLTLKQTRPAIEYARRLPQMTVAHGIVGRALLMEDRTAEAVTELEKAAPSDQDGSLHYKIFLAYRKLQQPVKAQAALRRAQELRSTRAQAYLEEVQIRRGPGAPSIHE
jgi:tetratricopeptide (TPR) repeat protein